MEMTSSLVLPNDVVLVPTADLPEALRARVGGEPGDYAISRPGSRSPSKLVDQAAAELLRSFQTPTTIVDAVIRYSQDSGHNPDEILVEAFPLLQRLVQSRFLVEADSVEAARIQPTLAPGDDLSGRPVVRCLQVTEDAEVYQVGHEGGDLAVVKILRPGFETSMRHNLEREAAILDHLGGAISPLFLDAGAFHDRPYVRMEWCPGVAVSVAAFELRKPGDAGADARVLELCCNIADAYGRLHARGVVHGDVHPRNVIVGPQGSLKLLDFGLASIDGDPVHGHPPRGGLVYFYEPESARHYRSGVMAPAPTMAGEQYALAALCYQLLTGDWYLDFGATSDEMYRQIIEDEPLPFTARDVAAWPDVERALGIALNKNPADRFASVDALSARLRRAAPRPADAGGPAGGRPASGPSRTTTEGDSAASRFLAAKLPLYRIDGALLSSPSLPAPSVSVSYGRAGIALGLHRIACGHDDPDLLGLSDVWATSARRRIDDPRAFLNPELGVTDDIVGQVSTFFAAPGVHLAQAVIFDAMGAPESFVGAAQAFMAAAAGPCSNPDMTLGQASTLLGCALLHEIATVRGLAMPDLVALGAEISQSIWQTIDGFGPVGHSRDLSYLGIAHGWAGILYASMRWAAAAAAATAAASPAEVRTAAVPAGVRARLDELAECGQTIGRGMRWPIQLSPDIGTDQRAHMPGWCNGSAGYVALWNLAGQLTGDDWYRSLAEQAAWNSWEDADSYPSLCCGLAGRGYALLTMYRATGDRHWLDRAGTLAERAVQGVGVIPAEVNRGLYKGEMGIASLIGDVRRPDSARFPFYEPPV